MLHSTASGDSSRNLAGVTPAPLQRTCMTQYYSSRWIWVLQWPVKLLHLATPLPSFSSVSGNFTWFGNHSVGNRARSQIEGGQEKNQYFACPVAYTDDKCCNRRRQDQLANVERRMNRGEWVGKRVGPPLSPSSSLCFSLFLFLWTVTCSSVRIVIAWQPADTHPPTPWNSCCLSHSHSLLVSHPYFCLRALHIILYSYYLLLSPQVKRVWEGKGERKEGRRDEICGCGHSSSSCPTCHPSMMEGVKEE